MITAQQTTEERVSELLSKMTLIEKIGQMTQVEKNSITDGDISELGIGSILSGGGGNPSPNTPANWRAMVSGFKKAALESRLGIPLIYGSDAVHGHNNVKDATIFPHNIGLGATRDPELVRRIAQATARELKATEVSWDFAPAVSHPVDIRWGRSYEGYGQDIDLITLMSTAFVKGLIDEGVLPSVKHYVADGAASWGSSTRISTDDQALIENDPTLANAKVGEGMVSLLKLGAWKIDQGISEIDEETLRRDHLPPYISAIEAGAMNIMVSYSTWNGIKMHAQHYLLTTVLKGELGFNGFLVTDWEAIDQIDTDFYKCVVDSINAGIDMVMVPFRYQPFIETMVKAIEAGDVPIERVDDAVSRILRVKVEMGLFEQPYCDVPLELVGCEAHRALAREAVGRTLVLLKNEGAALPLPKTGKLFVAGQAADDIGYQCGGWTIEWMGSPGPITAGTTILEGLGTNSSAEIHFSPTADFKHRAPVGLVVIAEEPYAEGMGDRFDLNISPEQISLIEKMRGKVDKLVVVLLSGRPLIVADQLPMVDAFVAAWWPGSEGNGVSDVLLGDVPFSGKLTFEWPRSMQQIPLGSSDGQPPCWESGAGITTE